MGKITESLNYDDEIYLIESTDQVKGGENGISNKQAKSLANRTSYLKSQLLELIDAVYTKTQVDQKIADLVNSSPETLNTLKEIADALGDDPNFATTITNLLAKKVSYDDAASQTAAGIVRMATEDEMWAGEATNLALSPSSLATISGINYLSFHLASPVSGGTYNFMFFRATKIGLSINVPCILNLSMPVTTSNPYIQIQYYHDKIGFYKNHLSEVMLYDSTGSSYIQGILELSDNGTYLFVILKRVDGNNFENGHTYTLNCSKNMLCGNVS